MGSGQSWQNRFYRHMRSACLILILAFAAAGCEHIKLPGQLKQEAKPEEHAQAPGEKREEPPKPQGEHWDYESIDAWPELCKIGKVQSPIDIQRTIRAPLDELRFDYPRTEFTISNNGHTLQASSPSAGGVAIGETRFSLIQFHVHARSEHLIKGKSQEMEVHLVHKDAAGNLAVIGILAKKGAPNPVIEALLKNGPEKPGEKPGVILSTVDLLPKNAKYFTYTGSLTTPGCSEGLKWIVLKDPIDVSEEQLARFHKLFPHNARPVQNLNHRMVLESE